MEVTLDLEEAGGDDAVVVVQEEVPEDEEDEDAAALGPVDGGVVQVGLFLDALELGGAAWGRGGIDGMGHQLLLGLVLSGTAGITG